MSSNNGTALKPRKNIDGDLSESPTNGNEEVDPSSSLAQWVADARERLAVQSDPALREAKTDAELAAEAELEQFRREQRRRQERRRIVAAVRDEDAADKRARKTARWTASKHDGRTRADARLAEWREHARGLAERLTSRDMRLAQLARQLTWTRRLIVALVLVGMAWSAVNVQHNLVPSGDMSQPLYWISYGVEALVSGCLVVLMLTSATLSRWGRSPSGKWGGYTLEVVLVLVSLGLNVGTPLAAGHVGRAAEYAVAPLAVGLLVWTYNWSTAALSRVLAEAAPVAESGRLDDDKAELLSYVRQASMGLERGELVPSAAEYGGGVPAAGKLAAYLGVSKPRAIEIRDAMRCLRTG